MHFNPVQPTIMNRIHFPQREKTLRAGWIIGLWAIFPASTAFFLGRSSVQFADLIRRGVETFSIFFSWKGIRKINRMPDMLYAQKVEKVNSIIVSCALIISSLVVVFLSITRFLTPVSHGVFWPGIIVASVDFIINGYFTQKNFFLSRIDNNQIMHSQWKLYASKSLINLSVLMSLTSYYYINNKNTINLIDLASGVCIALFMQVMAISNLRKNNISREQGYETNL